MKNKWKRIGLLVGIIFMVSSTSVFANEEPTIDQKKEDEKANEFLHYTPVAYESLSESEKEFVEKNRYEPGIFQQGTLYLIALGQRPHPGYGLEFVKSDTTWEQEKIFVRQTLPKEGMMYPQVIHYPYIIGRLQLPTKYMTVSVIDIDTGKDLFEKIQPNPQNDQSVIKVMINSKLQSLDQPPILKGNRTMVPLRGIFESLGAQVHFDQNTGHITVTKEELTIKLKLNSKSVEINGKIKTIDVPAFTENDRTLVPLRFISEAIGADVKWDGVQNTVFINTGK